VKGIDYQAPKYVSTVTIAELQFGIRLAESFEYKELQRFREIIKKAREYPLLGISKHTGDCYAELKGNLAKHFLPNLFRKEGRPRYIEDWVDEVSGKKLQIDENDLWLSAQALERNLILLTTERKILRIREANPDLEIERV